MKVTPEDLPRSQSRTLPPPPTNDLSGKTVIVIGANTGLGLEACYQFARMSAARIIMGCRSLEKGTEAVKKLENETGSKNAEAWAIDLADHSSVVDFANKFKQDGGRLDILLMNAGIVAITYRPSPKGYESTIQVNHLSTTYLTLLLTPILVKTAKEHGTSTRVSLVASEVHHYTAIPSDDLKASNLVEFVSTKEYCEKDESRAMKVRYPLSKLFNVLTARAYASHFIKSTSPPHITITSSNPGWCKTDLSREVTGERRISFDEGLNKIGFTAEQGSRMIVRAAVWQDGPGEGDGQLNGGYCTEETVMEPSDYVISGEGSVAQEKLWNDTIALLSKEDPEIKTIVGECFN